MFKEIAKIVEQMKVLDSKRFWEIVAAAAILLLIIQLPDLLAAFKA